MMSVKGLGEVVVISTRANVVFFLTRGTNFVCFALIPVNRRIMKHSKL